jgi:hypothetical protein
MREEETKERWWIDKWNVKCEMWLLWKKNSDHKNDDQLRNEMGYGIVIRDEEESKEQ